MAPPEHHPRDIPNWSVWDNYDKSGIEKQGLKDIEIEFTNQNRILSADGNISRFLPFKPDQEFSR